MSAVINLDSSDDDNEVVEITETTSEVCQQARQKMYLNPMGHMTNSQEFHKEFVDLMNLCFKFENSQGMERILTKNLIPNFKELDNEYAKSDKLKCFLKNMVKKLKKEPNMKFSCLKEVSENFKANKIKKRVNIVTLSNKASDKFKRYYNMQNKKRKKNKKDNIIILDENNDPHPQIINLDDELNDVIDLESCDNTNSIGKCLHNDVNSDKSSLSNTETMEKQTKDTDNIVHMKNVDHNVVDSDSEGNMDHTNIIVSDSEKLDQSDDDNTEIDHTFNYNDNKNSNENTAEIINTDSEEIVEIRSDTLNPISATNNNYKSTMANVDSNNDLLNVSSARKVAESTPISQLELEIKHLKQNLQRLEETEVLSDGFNSPYFEAHKLKLLIIEKYKKICELRGEVYKPRKCTQFQLQVIEGHPAGPARKLEDWLNTNVDKNGEPSFPNLRDVTKCVWLANQEDGLGWDINRSYQEARILFAQCGQHLQRRRKQREWRDLLQTAKTPVDRDPADSDPELLRKLEANRQLAKDKFEGIIDHYAKLEEDSRKPKKRIKIIDVKSLSDTNNAQTPCWEVPITGMIKITPVAPQDNHKEPNADIKQENIDESVNSSEETSNHVANLNETSENNALQVAYILYNSAIKNNNNTIQTEGEQMENSIVKSNKNALQNSQELNNTDNTNTIESNSASTSLNSRKSNSQDNSTLEQNSELKLPDKPKNVSVTSAIKTEITLTSDKDKANGKLISDAKQNHSESQTARNKVDCVESMETEELISQIGTLDRVEKGLHSHETMETDQQNINQETDQQNINKDNESNTVTENAQIIDKNNKSIADEDGKEKNNDLVTQPNDKSIIKSEVKMEIDFSEEDFDLMLDKNFSCDTGASATVFDVEDTFVFIEITSSDSESDDDCQLISL